eukprot:1474867-Pleurochrysis_carterae.AAC.2
MSDGDLWSGLGECMVRICGGDSWREKKHWSERREREVAGEGEREQGRRRGDRLSCITLAID